MERDASGPRRQYRIVRSDPPRLEDFLSNAARGRPLPTDPEFVRLQDGLSTFAELEQAVRKARQYPALGAYVAELDIPETPAVRIERTLQRSRGHHTVWGNPSYLLTCTVWVVPVEFDGER